jgi:post-segregation antitoxin (ccd killing protein)
MTRYTTIRVKLPSKMMEQIRKYDVDISNVACRALEKEIKQKEIEEKSKNNFKKIP